MGTTLARLSIDALDPAAVARFWAELLGWQVVTETTGEVTVRGPAPRGAAVELAFVPVAAPKEVKNRIHLDVASATAEHQRSLVDSAVERGAQKADIGQGPAPWEVLADPEGNEFCVLEPRPEYADTGALAAIVVDAYEPRVLAEFWAAALGGTVVRRYPELVGLRMPDGEGPWLEILQNDDLVPQGRRIRPVVVTGPGADVEAEVARLSRLGARPLESAGSAERAARAFADPEGGAFELEEAARPFDRQGGQ
ncbi:VOC family protein [Prauserella muralis]|uniref:Glyoxalase-like domain-containing protein n=1 Tax=Prauserella muralis TaxID=588067 RepID=A0A2V4AI58_9PSEU|nr:VOC family protein [Prauserella muralis]PXY19604.1 hypothetical protein BAY60_33355 [Prauserella muralis]TWE29609.1 hypothetical protein FHX69_2296 [Prauserella muralis]